MYIHIGAGENVRERDIIGVFDIDGKNYSDVNRDFLREEEKKGRVKSAGGGKVILTHISSSGVRGRLKKRKLL